MAKPTKIIKKTDSKTVFQTLNNYLLKNNRIIFWVILAIGSVLALLSFNARISEAHDDALYIEAGYRYVHEFPNYYYTSNAPMYPMFLALLTMMLGTNLIVFKLFSILFFIMGPVIYYKALDKKVPEILKFFVFSFLCINHMIIYFASQTFSESFYLLMQAIFFYYFSRYNFSENPISTNLKIDYKKWLWLGFLMMILTLAKNILVFGIAAILLFYFIKKEYKKTFYALVSFGIFKLLYELIKNAIWGASAIQYNSQVNILLNKDPYDASQGQEDLSGFFGRLFDNIGLYLGKRFYQILGFIEENYTNSFAILAFLVIALTVYGLYIAIKRKNAIISFFLLFAGTILFGTFFVLQARWDQPRFLLVHMPAVLLGMFYGMYTLVEKDNFTQRIFILLIILVLGSMFISSAKRALANIPIVTKNLKGDKYYGYTPDWQSFLKASAWCADSLPKESLVASRKAPMSFVYGHGKKFFPIYSVIKKDTVTSQSNPDSALAFFKKNKVTHIILGSLRIDPTKNTGQIINTVHNIAQPIMQKYPDKLQIIHTEGSMEPAYVLKIKY